MALQFIRGLDADRLSLTPAAGEPLFTTDTLKLYIGDGSTVGGVEVTGTDSATVISIIQENVFDSADISTLFNAFLAIKSTSDVAEGNNLYYTQARVDSDINAIVSALDTDNIPEAGNLYYTQARVDSDITNTVTQSYVNALLIDADTLDGQNGTYFLDYNNFNNTPSNVSEFSNDAGYTTYDSADATGQITAAINALIAGAPGALDTLNELAAALGDDANFATTVTNAIAALPDSAEVATIVTDIVDSAYITARTPPSLTIREVDSADNVNKTINSVSAINFDNWTGFQVTDLGGGEVKVALGSGFKTITVDGQDNIVAIGEDTLAIDAGTNVTLATDAVTKTLTISATFDSAEVTSIVDSAYVTARIPEIPSVTVSGTAPASPTEGDLWYDNVTTGQLYTYVGTSWLSTAGLTTLQFSSVGDLSDVDITTAAPTDGQFLAWDSANSKFIPGSETPQDFAYSSLTGAPTNVSSFTNDAGYITSADALDSVETQALIDAAVAALVDTAPATLDTLNELAAALGDDANFATTVTNAIAALPDSSEVQAIATTLVDSAYVQARQTPQDFAYSSLTGAPTNVSSFTNDANYLDSNTVTGVIDATYINSLVTATDSAAVINIVTDTVDSAYVTARIPEIPSVTVSGTAPASPTEGDLWYDNVTTGQLYTYVGTSWVSTAGLTTLQFSSIADLADVDSSAPTDGQYLTWNSATSQYVPTTLDAGTDSATVASIVTSTVDSAYVQARQTPQDFAYSSLTGAPTTVSTFTNDANYIATGDSATLATLTTTGNVIVGGNLQVNGTTVTVNATDLDVTDNMIYMNAGESAGSPTASIDVGWAANVNDQGSYYHVGLFRDATDQTFKVYHQYTPEPDAAVQINTGDASFALAPFAASTLTGVYQGFDSDVTAAGLATQTYVTSTIDSAYINARVSATDSAAVISIITDTVDSAYVNGLVTIPSGVTVSGTAPASPTEGDLWYDNVTTGQLYTYVGTSWLSTAGLTTLQFSSIADLSDVDSSAPTEGQYLAWNGTKYVPTTLAAGTDSAAVVNIITAEGFTKYDSNDTIGLVDSAYISSRFPTGGSSNVIVPFAFAFANTTSNGSGTGISWSNWNSGNSTLDFTFDVAQPNTDYAVVTESETYDDYFVGITNKATTGFRAEFYDGSGSRQPSAFSPFTFLVYGSNPQQRIAGLVGDYIDSATASALIESTVDSAYIQARQITQDFAYSSLTGAPTNVSSFTNDAGYLTTAIDSAEVATIVTSYGYTTFDSSNASGLITTAINNLVDAAPAALDTLNELAAALGDDANFATTITNAIAALPDSAEVATIVTSYGYTTFDSADAINLIDSAYINARVTSGGGGGVDSAAIESLIDSDYIINKLVATSTGPLETTAVEAAAGQTVFTVSHNVNSVAVYLNGFLLKETDDYVANGSAITLTVGANLGDLLTVHSFSPNITIGSGGGGGAGAATVYALSALFNHS